MIVQTKPTEDRFSGLSSENPVQQHTLYFSQIEFPAPTPEAPDAVAEEFYITLEGNKPRVYDANNLTPDISVKEGTVEEWTVENRSPRSSRLSYPSNSLSCPQQR